ncbi:hypothetical protein [Nocardioides pinisoli]|uniref:Uncharacterized protein n=1 Tax=Nocardioides pinisoli TaxID=2950279 RepID=A0ABT1KSE9_9ACTN|nr:hypothetical protein [Nocardioides pinisoli]MCP3420284.1 hypothetical protein [Nocardioides pinisoli]
MTIDGFRAGVLFAAAGALLALLVDQALGSGLGVVAALLGFVAGLLVQQTLLWSVVVVAVVRGAVRWAARRR